MAKKKRSKAANLHKAEFSRGSKNVAVAGVLFWCALSVWACRTSWHLLRPGDLTPVFLLVVLVMVAVSFLSSRGVVSKGPAVVTRNIILAQTIAGISLVLAIVYGLGHFVPERLPTKESEMVDSVNKMLEEDPVAKGIKQAYMRAATGQVSEPYHPPELEEAIDVVRNFVHGWLSHNIEHASIFVLLKLRNELAKAKLPPHLITDISAVSLKDIKIEDHLYNGTTHMLVKVSYKTWTAEIELERDFGWQVAKLPIAILK